MYLKSVSLHFSEHSNWLFFNNSYFLSMGHFVTQFFISENSPFLQAEEQRNFVQYGLSFGQLLRQIFSGSVLF